MDIILLGDPAAGKATQAAFLLKKYKLRDFDMGKELRKVQRGRDNAVLKQRLARTLNKGKLAPTDIVRQILKQKIQDAPAKTGILFDGTPKMISEARLVAKWLAQAGRTEIYFIYLSIPDREIFKRMSSRREYFKGKFSKRPDDNPKAMRQRIKYFRSGIKKVINFFSKSYPSRKISGLGSRNQVHRRIVKALNELAADKN